MPVYVTVITLHTSICDRFFDIWFHPLLAVVPTKYFVQSVSPRVPAFARSWLCNEIPAAPNYLPGAAGHLVMAGILPGNRSFDESWG